jgi:hypothetical protein
LKPLIFLIIFIVSITGFSYPSIAIAGDEELSISAPGTSPAIGDFPIMNPEAANVPGTTRPLEKNGRTSPCGGTPCEKIFHPPSFKVVFHNSSGQNHLLIQHGASLKQIESLIHYLAEERKGNGLEKLGIPPNGSGDYVRGSILVFKDIKWARGERLTNPRVKEKTYGRYVLAEYIWNNHFETAYMGQKTLFNRTLPGKK